MPSAAYLCASHLQSLEELQSSIWDKAFLPAWMLLIKKKKHNKNWHPKNHQTQSKQRKLLKTTLMSPIHLPLIGISHLSRFVTSLFPSNSQLSFYLSTLLWIFSSMAHLFFCTNTDLWFKYLSFFPGRYRELLFPLLPGHLWPFPFPAETNQVLLVVLHRNDSILPLILAPIICPSSQFNLYSLIGIMDLYTAFPDAVSDLVQQRVFP